MISLLLNHEGGKLFQKSIWKSFEAEFQKIEEEVSDAKHEVTEELRLASEQEMHSFRCLLLADMEENKRSRIDQLAEMHENKIFRSEQTLALAWQVQNILKDEGNSLIIFFLY